MGVTGLWKLIEPCGKPVPVETLEGKVLAVDISIWLHQVIKGFQDNKGSALPNAHLLGLFHRLCKLLYYRVKPVFVFDGCVPQLKRDTIIRRQQQRSKLNTEAERIQALLLQSLAKEKVVQQALGASVEQLLKSPTKRPSAKANAREDVDDMFKLPELPASSKNGETSEAKEDSSDCYDCTLNSHGGSEDSFSTDESSSFDDSNARNFYNANLQAIDVKSQHFKDLPADVRHEILVDIKETRKQSSWGRLHELPSRGDDFSVFQMKRLLKRRAVQESLEEAEQQMGGKTLTYAELTNMFTEEGILEADVLEKGTKQICSDEHTRFLLVRDLKKKLIKTEEKLPIEEKIKEEAPAPKKSIDTVTIINEEKRDKMGKEFDTELQLALAISLEQTQVYSESDYQYEGNEELKLSRAQRNRLQNAAVGPARAYMIEYGGMNEEEVEGIMERTQTRSDLEESFEEEGLKESGVEDGTSLATDAKISEEKTDQGKNVENMQSEDADSQEICLRMSDSDTDTDLEEVVEGSDPADSKNKIENAASKAQLEVVVELKDEIAPDDDLFADIFETAPIVETEKKETITKTTPIDIEIKKSESITIHEASEKVLNKSTKCSDNPKNEDSQNKSGTTAVVESILSNLKSQLDEVKNIKLEDIQIASTVIEISDDEMQKKSNPSKSPDKPMKTEIIEICDSDDALSGSAKPGVDLKTPPKHRSILEYYQADYVVKRQTPDKPNDDESEDVPKVKSPFFVNKTPKSSRKRLAQQDTSPSPSPKRGVSKASKSLFEKETSDDNHQETEVEGIEPLKTPLNTEDIIKEAAQQLKEQKTDEELQEMASDLARERLMLESERNRQDRMGMSISQRMSIECQELLKLFGIPYIVAPMEAEAQCAFLDSIELTNGTITDDSDIWLFGGRTVYKNFFAQNKHVLEFRSEKIQNSFNCDRKKLIQLACLVGSDYTTGVHGIGAVTALEILAAFASNEAKNDAGKSGEQNIMTTVLQTLSKFREWWLTHKSSTSPQGSSTRLALRKKLKNIELHEGFPSLAVIEAYLAPKVDDSRDNFSWGYPDVESIREYAKKTFGWTTTKTNEILAPVLKRLNDKKSQATIRSYFTTMSAISPRDLKVSKRVQKAIDRMSGKIEEAETPERPTKSKTKRTVRKKKVQHATEDEEDVAECVGDAAADEKISSTTSTLPNEILSAEEPSSTSKTAAAEATRKRVSSNLHNKKSDLIPQREKDKAKLLENKAKAAEIFKNSVKADSPAKKKKRQAN